MLKSKVKSQKSKFRKAILFYFCLFTFALLISCSSKPTDMRSLVPADTLVYLETNDLGVALQPIIDSKPFNEVAKRKPDISALRGVQLAVAVTGFETREEKLTDEHSVGRVQPHFVAVADTHAWNSSAVAFAEQKLGAFVEKIYDSPPTLEKTDKNGGKYFTWIAKDGRKAYALVIDGLVYFGNDETAIDKCLTVRRGEADSVAKTGKVQSASQEILASGYVSTDGIAQISNIIGLKFASEAGEDPEVQSSIAGILPQLLRNSITEISWTESTNTWPGGIQDDYVITMPSEMSSVFSETLIPLGNPNGSMSLIPTNFRTATRYNLKSLPIAWRSIISALQNKMDPLETKVSAKLSPVFFQPYGVADPKMFLESVGPQLVTIASSDEESAVAVIGAVRDYPQFTKSISKDLSLPKDPSQIIKNTIIRSADGDLGIVFLEYNFILGDPAVIESCLVHDNSTWEFGMQSFYGFFNEGKPTPIVTAGRDRGAVKKLVEMFTDANDSTSVGNRSLTETRFTKAGMERKTTSDFGLIGSIIAQLGED